MAKNEKKPMSQKKRIVIFLLCSLLALAVCMGVVVGVALSMVTDGVYEGFVEPEKESLSAQPQTVSQTLSFVQALIKKASDNSTTKLSSSFSIQVPDDSIQTQSEDFRNTVIHVKEKMLSGLKAQFPADINIKFGEGFTAFPQWSIPQKYIKEAVCIPGSSEDSAHSNTGRYYFDFTVDGCAFPSDEGAQMPLVSVFALDTQAKAVKAFYEPMQNEIKIENCVCTPEDFSVSLQSDRFTDKLIEWKLRSAYQVSLTLAFDGKLKDFGTQTLSFRFISEQKYSYTFAGITCSETMDMEKGSEQQLSASCVLNEDLIEGTDYIIRFESEDSNLVSVDALGFLSAHENCEAPVPVRVILDYLGHEYITVCEVTVKTPVEKIKISQDEAVLAKGQTLSLSAELSPKQATMKTVLWVSDDESIATVDANGTVTAVSSGNVIIRAVAKDGYFQDLCTVTVTA